MNIGNKEYASGLTYTALSRAKKLENIAFDPFPGPERITNISTNKMFKIRVKEEDRLRDKELERKRCEKDLALRDIAEDVFMS